MNKTKNITEEDDFAPIDDLSNYITCIQEHINTNDLDNKKQSRFMYFIKSNLLDKKQVEAIKRSVFKLNNKEQTVHVFEVPKLKILSIFCRCEGCINNIIFGYVTSFNPCTFGAVG